VAVGVREVTDHIGLISFMHYDLRFFDESAPASGVPPIPSLLKCQRCVRNNRYLGDRNGPWRDNIGRRGAADRVIHKFGRL
jgi:hypothetical protein